MKKLLAIILAALMLVPMLAACDRSGTQKGDYKVAMITDYGDITDQSFNQTTYEACKEYCDANKIDFQYFKPAGDSTEERVAKVEEAIDGGYNIIVMPGFAFAGTLYQVQDKEEYKDVKFIALDVSEYDLFDCFYKHDETGARAGLIDENNKEHISENVYCAVYKEELCGYMAGYAAVKLGYTHLGFLGGMAVPAVIRYGYGFVQGCNDAGKAMNDEVTVEYVYGNKFAGTPEITAYMDTWYQEKGVQVVFACGGGIYTSATEAAKKANGKVIGVDTDQAATINKLGTEGMTVTSAMKGLAPTVKHLLSEVVAGNFANYGGKIETLGLVSANPEENYVQIPTASTQFEDGKFTQADYEALVAAMFAGDVTVSNDITAMPAVTNVTVEDFGNLK